MHKVLDEFKFQPYPSIDFYCGSLLLLVLDARIYTLVQLLC